MNRRWSILAAAAVLSLYGTARAGISVPMHLVDEQGIRQQVGTVDISPSPYGLVFTPALAGLPPGMHGFHVHENPSCAPKDKDGKMVAALAAGGHYDPGKTGRHGLPWGDSHLGDLPALYVDGTGAATTPVLAPRLRLEDVKARSLMIHVGGDNHADHPQPLGGGGPRLVCGVIE